MSFDYKKHREEMAKKLRQRKKEAEKLKKRRLKAKQKKAERQKKRDDMRQQFAKDIDQQTQQMLGYDPNTEGAPKSCGLNRTGLPGGGQRGTFGVKVGGTAAPPGASIPGVNNHGNTAGQESPAPASVGTGRLKRGLK